MKVTIYCLIATSLTTALFAQQPGDLDSTFGVNGIVTTDVANNDNWANSIVIQNDGKIIVAGEANPDTTGKDFALARYNPNGTLDSSFGIGGIETTDFSGFDDEINAIALQQDGKIVAAGFSASSFALARYNTNGTLDTTFSTDGMQTLFLGMGSVARSVAIQPNGKIVVAGYADNGLFLTGKDFALTRYNPDGSLDSSFNNIGILTIDFHGRADEVYSMVVQPGGKIVAAGYANTGTSNDFALVRLYTDGTLDSSFNAGGKVTTDFFSNDDIAYSMTLQSDEKIVVAGYSSDTRQDFAIARYNTDGILDTSFSSDGKLITAINTINNDFASAVAIQPDGKIILAGITNQEILFGPDYRFALARYHPNGTLDNNFGTNGKIITAFRTSSARNSMVIQPDGKIVVAGYSYNTITKADFAVVRYISGLNIVLVNIEGIIITEQGVPIPGASVTLSGDDIQAATTAIDGHYSFTVAQGGNYTVTPSKNNDSIPNNGITSLDVLLMRKHILSIAPLPSPYKIIAAAEVNADGDTTITTQDILFTRSLILGNSTSFPTNRLWQFVSSDYVFPDTQHPFPFDKTRTYTNITNQTNQNFIGIKLGDVNGSWDGNIP